MFSTPNVVLNEPCKYSGVNPIAVNTCDGSVDAELHAEPLDAQIPFSSNLSSKSPPIYILK